MKKTELKKIVRLYAASVLENAMNFGIESNHLTEEELYYMQEQMEKIALKISKGEEYDGSSLDNIVLHVAPNI